MAGRIPILRSLTCLPDCWAQRLFPGPNSFPDEACPRLLLLQGCLLALVAGALLLTRLTCPLLEPEEARYAEIPRQMLAEGRWVEPVLHGQPYYQKPPVLYWLVMVSYQLFGVHDWAARVVPALASFGSIFIIWFWGRRVFGPAAGFWAALILALSVRFVYLGRMVTCDPLLSIWVIGALAAGHLAVRGPRLRWPWWLCSALLSGMGVLTKGPVALALVLGPVFVFQFLDRRSARPSLGSASGFLALAIGVAGPWYAAMAHANPEAAFDFFWQHNVQRFLNPVDHQEPPWFFLPGLLLGTLPWSLLLVPLARWLLDRSGSVATRPPAALGFCVIALCWCVGFFSLSGCKRVGYILPALPLLAMCLGCCFGARKMSGAATWHWRSAILHFGGAALVFVVLFLGVLLWLPGYHRRFALRGQVRPQIEEAANCTNVVCYPKRWDSVSFYLHCNNIRVFTGEQKDALMAVLQGRGATLMFVKNPWVNDFRAQLPASLEFVPVGRHGTTMTVGIVRDKGF
jgi:4-amino-4-deoxy-L-arabinose transferase-like glycosyltransferase